MAFAFLALEKSIKDCNRKYLFEDLETKTFPEISMGYFDIIIEEKDRWGQALRSLRKKNSF